MKLKEALSMVRRLARRHIAALGILENQCRWNLKCVSGTQFAQSDTSSCSFESIRKRKALCKISQLANEN